MVHGRHSLIVNLISPSWCGLCSKLRRESFNAAVRIQLKVFQDIMFSFKAMDFFFFFLRVNSIAGVSKDLSYQEGLIELKICPGEGKTGVRKTG